MLDAWTTNRRQFYSSPLYNGSSNRFSSPPVSVSDPGYYLNLWGSMDVPQVHPEAKAVVTLLSNYNLIVALGLKFGHTLRVMLVSEGERENYDVSIRRKFAEEGYRDEELVKVGYIPDVPQYHHVYTALEYSQVDLAFQLYHQVESIDYETCRKLICAYGTMLTMRTPPALDRQRCLTLACRYGAVPMVKLFLGLFDEQELRGGKPLLFTDGVLNTEQLGEDGEDDDVFVSAEEKEEKKKYLAAKVLALNPRPPSASSDKNVPSEGGEYMTPLEEAASWSQLKVVEVLLNHPCLEVDATSVAQVSQDPEIIHTLIHYFDREEERHHSNELLLDSSASSTIVSPTHHSRKANKFNVAAILASWVDDPMPETLLQRCTCLTASKALRHLDLDDLVGLDLVKKRLGQMKMESVKKHDTVEEEGPLLSQLSLEEIEELEGIIERTLSFHDTHF